MKSLGGCPCTAGRCARDPGTEAPAAGLSGCPLRTRHGEKASPGYLFVRNIIGRAGPGRDCKTEESGLTGKAISIDTAAFGAAEWRKTLIFRSPGRVRSGVPVGTSQVMVAGVLTGEIRHAMPWCEPDRIGYRLYEHPETPKAHHVSGMQAGRQQARSGRAD